MVRIKLRNIFLYVFISTIILVLFELYIKPYSYTGVGKVADFFNEVKQSQTISPERLYVNVWRQAKMDYVNEDMNNQDWQRWRNKYSGKIKTIDDANVAINTMLSSLNDPYTKFLPSGSFAKEKKIIDSKISGTGVEYNKTGDEVVVDNVIKDSSAFKQSVLPGDKIVKINGIEVKNLETKQIQKLMENPTKNKTYVTIKRGDQVLKKELKKTDIPLNTMKYYITDENIALVNLNSIMGEKAIYDFANIIKKTNNAKAIIFDVRDNYGGILANSLQMVDLMMSEEKILDIKSRKKEMLEVYADEKTIFKKKPIGILVNRKTASAAEIFAGALKDSMNAIVIGENTFGKNTIQQVIPMANKTGLFLTTNKYILPLGEDISKRGITPNFYIRKSKDDTSDIVLEEAQKLLGSQSIIASQETQNTL